jgi:hypothetical protein
LIDEKRKRRQFTDMEENERKTSVGPGSIIRFNSGGGSPDYFGVLVERIETEWGQKYGVILDDGRKHFASRIYTRENMPKSGSPIGAFLEE